MLYSAVRCLLPTGLHRHENKAKNISHLIIFMKKTLIAFMALCSSTFAVDFTPETTLGFLYRNDQGDFVTFGDATYSADTYSLQFADADLSVAAGATQKRITYTVAVTLDLAKLPVLTSNTKLVTTSVDGITDTGIGLTTARTIATVWGNTVPWSSSTAGAALGSEGEVTLIYSTSSSGSSYFIEGQSFSEESEAWNWSKLTGTFSNALTLNKFTLNSELIDAITRVAVWTTPTAYGATPDAKTQATAIYGTMELLPEPTTATLSLLALAGLMARRKRH